MFPRELNGNLRFSTCRRAFQRGGQVANSQETMSSSAHLPPLGVAFYLRCFKPKAKMGTFLHPSPRKKGENCPSRRKNVYIYTQIVCTCIYSNRFWQTDVDLDFVGRVQA